MAPVGVTIDSSLLILCEAECDTGVRMATWVTGNVRETDCERYTHTQTKDDEKYIIYYIYYYINL